MKHKKKINNFLIYLYKYILPIISVFGLIGVASINGHSPMANQPLVDFLVRLFLTVWFCITYKSLTKDQKLSIEKGISYEKDTGEKVLLSLFGIVFSIFLIFGTFWILQTFFVFHRNLSIVISIVNGILIVIPHLTGLPNSAVGRVEEL